MYPNIYASNCNISDEERLNPVARQVFREKARINTEKACINTAGRVKRLPFRAYVAGSTWRRNTSEPTATWNTGSRWKSSKFTHSRGAKVLWIFSNCLRSR